MLHRLYLQQLMCHSAWQTKQLYQKCANVSDAQRKQDMGAYFGSIHGTLNHLLLVDKLWLARMRAESFAVSSLMQQLHCDFEALRADQLSETMRLTQWLKDLSDKQMSEEFEYMAVTEPKTKRCSYWKATLNLFTHQIHHRGQITTLLMQLGHDPGVTDLMFTPE